MKKCGSPKGKMQKNKNIPKSYTQIFFRLSYYPPTVRKNVFTVEKSS